MFWRKKKRTSPVCEYIGHTTVREYDRERRMIVEKCCHCGEVFSERPAAKIEKCEVCGKEEVVVDFLPDECPAICVDCSLGYDVIGCAGCGKVVFSKGMRPLYRLREVIRGESWDVDVLNSGTCPACGGRLVVEDFWIPKLMTKEEMVGRIKRRLEIMYDVYDLRGERDG